MFDRKNDVARNKKRADAIVYAGAADEVVLTQSDFESEEEFRCWKAWSDADYKQTEKAMRRDYDHVIYGLDGKEFSVQEEDKQKDIIVDETKIRAILTERQFKRLSQSARRMISAVPFSKSLNILPQGQGRSYTFWKTR